MPDGTGSQFEASAGGAPASRGRLEVRTLDLIVGLAGLIFFAPALAVVAAAIWFLDPGPIIYAHRRVGAQGREFNCLKFRTMAVDGDSRLEALLATSPTARWEWEQYRKVTADPRITPLGAFLRASSLDELPQLINVLRGEMSLVGPRPIVRAEAYRYGRYFTTYCSVRPGITGLWQVLGRNRVSYRRRVAMDVLYVRRRSLALNLWILVATIPAVIFRKGAV